MSDNQRAYEVLDWISSFSVWNSAEIQAIVHIVMANYPSLEEGIEALSYFIENSKIKPSIGKRAMELLNKHPNGKLHALNLIWQWSVVYLPVYITCSTKWDEITDAIKKAYGCLFRIVVDDFKLKNISKLRVKTTWRTYHRTGEIVVGMLNLCNDYAKGYILEYLSYGKRLFPNCVKDGGVCKVYLEPEDLDLIPAFILAHEYAHYIAWVKHGHRRRESGRREIHDEIFVETYNKLLHLMANKCFPELKKYIS